MSVLKLLREAAGRITPAQDSPPTVSVQAQNNLETDYRDQSRALILSLISGGITVDAWLREMEKLNLNIHLAMYLLGIGGAAQLDANDIADVMRIGGEQRTYLSAWAAQLTSQGADALTLAQRTALLADYDESMIPTDADALDALVPPDGVPSIRALLARAMLYWAATHTTLQIAQGASIGLPRMPAYPGERSECRVNCKCEWRYVKVKGGWDCYWTLGAAEHCPTCKRRAAEWNPLRVRNGVFVY